MFAFLIGRIEFHVIWRKSTVVAVKIPLVDRLGSGVRLVPVFVIADAVYSFSLSWYTCRFGYG